LAGLKSQQNRSQAGFLVACSVYSLFIHALPICQIGELDQGHYFDFFRNARRNEIVRIAAGWNNFRNIYQKV
jgi:hypothetical protein